MQINSGTGCVGQVNRPLFPPKYIKSIGGEYCSTKFEHQVWPDSSANGYFFAIPKRQIPWKIQPCGTKFQFALEVFCLDASFMGWHSKKPKKV